MTIGSYNRSQNSPTTMQFKQWFPKSSIPEPANWTSRQDQESKFEKSRVWSGGDRPSPVNGPKTTVTRYYTTYEMLPGPRGRLIRTKVKKSYQFLRPLKRAKDNSPHDYVCNYRSLVDPCNAEIRHIVYDNVADELAGVANTITSYRAYQFTRDWYPTPTYPSVDSNFQIELVNKLKSQLRGSDFNMAIFLGEGHEALAMIASSATRLASAYRAFRKGDFVNVAKHLAVERPSSLKRASRKKKITSPAANNWLEWQYGWLPLLSDMKSGAEQLSHLLHVPFKKRYYVVKRKTMDRRNPEASSNEKRYWSEAKESTSRRLLAIISEPESLPVVSGLLDPELVAWELTPFSFVADWVIPIGDYLEARAFATRLSGTFVTSDLKKCIYSGFKGARITDTNNPSGVRTVITGSSGTFRFESTQVTRSVSSSLVVPMPSVKPFSKIASWMHCANAIALLAQAVKH